VVPVEEILVQKMLCNRSGKWQDKEDVKLLLETQKIKKKTLIDTLTRWEVTKEKQKYFIKKIKSFRR
jgi:hypothetical protein